MFRSALGSKAGRDLAARRPYSRIVPRAPFRAVAGFIAAAASVLASNGVGFAQVIDGSLWVTNGSVRAVIRDGGTVYIGGTFTQVGPATGGAVPLDAGSGALPPSFPKVTGFVYAVVSDGAGGWYLGGSFSAVGGSPRSNLAHVASDLSVSAWNPGANDEVYTLAMNGSTVYVGGYFTSVGGQARNKIAALDATTGAATAWDPNAGPGGFSAYVSALAVSGSTVYAGGYFTSVGGQARNYIAALDATTGAATAWDPNADDYVSALAVSGLNVYAGGGFTSIGGQARNYIAVLDATTGAARGWNPGANGPVFVLAVSGPNVYAGGYFSSVGGQVRNNIAAIEAGGGVTTAWNPNVNGQIHALALSGSTVYAGGEFTSVGGQARNHIAALNATTGAATAWDPNANRAVLALAVSGSTVYVGGELTSIGGEVRNNIAALDATTGAATAWDPNASIGQGFTGVFALCVSGSTVYAGGHFTSIGGQARNNIAGLDATTGAATAWDPNANDLVDALAVTGSIVYAGGRFTTIGGQARNRIAALVATSGAATAWNPNADSDVLALAVSGSTVYTGGNFTSIGRAFRYRIAALYASTGAATVWDPSADGDVLALLVSGSTIYAGGNFTSIGGQWRNGIAALETTIGAATAWDPNASNPYPYVSSVSALAVSGTTVYAGGSFTSIGGQARNGIAALNATTGAATAWDPNPGTYGFVYALAVGASTVYAGGGFSNFGGLPQSYIAAIVDPTVDVPTGSSGGSVAMLLENLPNPLRASTRITFALRSEAHVTLQVFDMAGRVVATLLRDEPTTAGFHQVEFRNPGLPSGLYLDRLQAGHDSVTRKMLVLQ